MEANNITYLSSYLLIRELKNITHSQFKKLLDKYRRKCENAYYVIVALVELIKQVYRERYLMNEIKTARLWEVGFVDNP